MSTALETRQMDLGLLSPTERAMSMVEQALEKGWTPEQLNGLLEFAKNVKAEAAKEAFFRAFKQFKDHAPSIIKNAEINHNGKRIGMYAKLEQVCDKLIPALGAVQITHRWTSKCEGQNITVTCFLRHEMGYEEEGSSITTGPDTSGAKNAVQAVGSTISYLQRYTLLASCGVTVRGIDTDGVTPEEAGGKLPEGTVSDWLAALEEASTIGELKSSYLAAARAATEAKDSDALRKFDEKKKDVWHRKGFKA